MPLPINVVIARWGSSGDVLPSVAVGYEMRRRGHDVTLVASPAYESRAREAGIAFAAVGTMADHERLIKDSDIWDRDRTTPEQIYTDHYYPLLPAFYETVRTLSRSARTVIIGGEAGAIAAAEKLRMPFVHLAGAPALSPYARSRFDPPHPERVLPPWAAWIARTGRGLGWLYRLNNLRHGRSDVPAGVLQLPETHPLGRLRKNEGLPLTLDFRPRLAIGLWPEWYAPRQPDWAPEAIATGFPLRIDQAHDEPAAAARARSGPIVVTTGSIVSGQERLYAIAADACRRLKRPAVLVTPHRNQVPRELPEGVRHLEFAPYDELFADAPVVLHHGGIGTTSYALASGAAQVIMPIRGDQFDNGNRVQRLGAGRMLSAARTDGAALADVIHRLASSSQVRQRCAEYRRRIIEEGGLRLTGDAIERIAPPA